MLQIRPDPRRSLSALVAVVALAAVLVVRADDPPAEKSDVSAEKSALAAFNGLIGDWRGTGQLKHGSNQGA